MKSEKATGVIPAIIALPTCTKIADIRANLRAELLNELQSIPSVEDLIDIYPSQHDREKVRRRLMLRAAHQLIFDNILCDPNPTIAPDGSIEIDVSDNEGISLFSTLSAAIRDFSSDAERLDQGLKADLVLEPVNYEGSCKPDIISADRKIILLAILFIDMRPPNITEKKQCAIASELTGVSAGTLRTYLRNMRAAQKAYKKKNTHTDLVFSLLECSHYEDMGNRMLKIVGRSNRSIIADLIAPGLRGLGAAHQKIRPKLRRKR